MQSLEEKASALIGEIKAAFDGVSREGGVSLHETRVYDDYGYDYEIFSPEQSRAIYNFLRFYVQYGEQFDQKMAQQAIDEYWVKFRDTTLIG